MLAKNDLIKQNWRQLERIRAHTNKIRICKTKQKL